MASSAFPDGNRAANPCFADADLINPETGRGVRRRSRDATPPVPMRSVEGHARCEVVQHNGHENACAANARAAVADLGVYGDSVTPVHTSEGEVPSRQEPNLV